MAPGSLVCSASRASKDPRPRRSLSIAHDVPKDATKPTPEGHPPGQAKAPGEQPDFLA